VQSWINGGRSSVKKKNLPKKPMHWAKRKKPCNEEEENLEVLDAKGGRDMPCEESQPCHGH